MLMECCLEKQCLVFEYCSKGSLEDRLARRGNAPPLPWYTRVKIAYEVRRSLLMPSLSERGTRGGMWTEGVHSRKFVLLVHIDN
jgi:hypothetical protein